MSKTNVPAIPAITAANLQDVAAAVKNLLDIREGLIGDPLDANVTFRDLVDAGLATVNFNLGTRGGSGSPVYPSWGSDDGYDPTQDFIPPSKPTGFTVTGLFSAIQLQWDKSPDRNFAYTEIWRSDTNVIGNAALIGTTDTRFFVDTVGTAATKYYWIRFVSQANVNGPYNAVSGTPGTAADDPTYVMGVLSDAYGVTSQAPFFQVNSDTTINGVTVHAGTYIKAAFIADATISNAMIKDAAINNAKIADLNATKINAGYISVDRLEAEKITGEKIAAGTITAVKIDSRGLSIKDSSGNVVFSANVKLTADYLNVSASGVGIHTFRVVASGNSSTSTPAGAGVYKDGTNITSGSRSYTVVKINRSTCDASLVGQYDVYAGGTAPGDMAAALNAIDSSYVVVVYTYDEPLGHRLEGGLEAAMYRCGASQAVFGSTNFQYRSAYVLVGIPGIGKGNGAEAYAGLTSSAADAWCDVGFSITNGIIMGVSGAYTPGNLTDYIPGGTLTADNASTYISSGALDFAFIKNNIQSSDYSATDQTGWKIDKGGQMEMNNATFRGTLNVRSSSTSGSTQIKNNVIKVFDSAGTLRVKIGDLSA